MGSKAKYLAIDLETTGLDPRKDRIIEVAALVLDAEFEEIECYSTAITAPRAVIKGVSEFIRNMHIESGLFEVGEFGGRSWVEQTHPDFPLDEVEEDLLDLSRDYFAPEDKPILVGSSVHFDRAFLEHWMPAFAARLSHRQVDDRTIKELAPRLGWEPPALGANEHRAMPDIRRTVENLRRARALLAGGAA